MGAVTEAISGWGVSSEESVWEWRVLLLPLLYSDCSLPVCSSSLGPASVSEAAPVAERQALWLGLKTRSSCRSLHLHLHLRVGKPGLRQLEQQHGKVSNPSWRPDQESPVAGENQCRGDLIPRKRVKMIFSYQKACSLKGKTIQKRW